MHQGRFCCAIFVAAALSGCCEPLTLFEVFQRSSFASLHASRVGKCVVSGVFSPTGGVGSVTFSDSWL